MVFDYIRKLHCFTGEAMALRDVKDSLNVLTTRVDCGFDQTTNFVRGKWSL